MKLVLRVLTISNYLPHTHPKETYQASNNMLIPRTNNRALQRRRPTGRRSGPARCRAFVIEDPFGDAADIC